MQLSTVVAATKNTALLAFAISCFGCANDVAPATDDKSFEFETDLLVADLVVEVDESSIISLTRPRFYGAFGLGTIFHGDALIRPATFESDESVEFTCSYANQVTIGAQSYCGVERSALPDSATLKAPPETPEWMQEEALFWVLVDEETFVDAVPPSVSIAVNDTFVDRCAGMDEDFRNGALDCISRAVELDLPVTALDLQCDKQVEGADSIICLVPAETIREYEDGLQLQDILPDADGQLDVVGVSLP